MCNSGGGILTVGSLWKKSPLRYATSSSKSSSFRKLYSKSSLSVTIMKTMVSVLVMIKTIMVKITVILMN